MSDVELDCTESRATRGFKWDECADGAVCTVYRRYTWIDGWAGHGPDVICVFAELAPCCLPCDRTVCKDGLAVYSLAVITWREQREE